MPLIQANGIRQYYRLEGRESAPAIVFAHSLGCDHSQWDEQALALERHFRILRYDLRGHGATDVTPGDYSIELLAQDVLALAAAVGIERFALCGLSLGGMIGQWLAANSGDRLTHLVLANTSPRMIDPTVMQARRQTVLDRGMAAIDDGVMRRFFSEATLAADPPFVARTRRVLLATGPAGYAGCCGAILGMDHRELIRKIRTPTMIVIGDHDVSTPLAGHGDVLVAEIAGARVEHLPTAHLSNLERPRSFNAALFSFLGVGGADTLAGGFAKRRSALGDAYVDRAIQGTTDFTHDFQEFITRFAWGAVWQRPGLDDRTRRMLALTALAALGRWEEFRLHVRTGLDRELEPGDLQELLLTAAIYAGVPVANTGFRIASEELA